MAQRKNILILSCDDRYSLNVIRCLVELNHKFILVGPEANNQRLKNSKLFSAFVNFEHDLENLAKASNPALSQLAQVIKKHNIDILSPSDYESLKFLAVNHTELEQISPIIPLPQIGLITELDDKALSYEYAKNLDIPTPDSVITDSHANLDPSIFERLGTPLIVKTAIGAGGTGVVKAEHLQDIRRFAEQNRGTILVQRFIDGIDYCFNAYAVNGEIKSWSLFRYIEFDKNGAKGKFVEFLHDEQVSSLAKKIIQDSNYTGPIVIDFRRDNTNGEFYFIEVNPRFGNNTNFSLLDGVNFFECGFNLALELDYFSHPQGSALWSCSLKRLFTAPFRKLDLSSIKLIIEVGIPQLKLIREQNKLLNG